MVLESLDGKLVVLNYNFGPFFNEEQGGEDVLTIWEIVNGRLSKRYHPGEPDEVDYDRPIQLLKDRRIKVVYTPSIDLYLYSNEFLGLRMRNDGGEHTDDNGITDWAEYDSILEGDFNWYLLNRAGLEIKIIENLEK